MAHPCYNNHTTYLLFPQSRRLMSERSITTNGVTYLPSRDAAKTVHLAPDYVSRLARGGLIDGRLNEGLWFVNLASLRDFIVHQERQRELWRAQPASGRPSAQVAAI